MKMSGMGIMFLVMILSLVIAGLWDSIPVIKSAVHAVLNPSAGILLDWEATWGLIILTGIVTLISTIMQKYMTDQKLLSEIKAEQKLVQEELKLYKEHPEKQMELSKKSMELSMKTMPITMRPVLYTIIPFVLLIRWFGDYFATNPAKILGMSGIWAYIVLSIVWSLILRKALKVQ